MVIPKQAPSDWLAGHGQHDVVAFIIAKKKEFSYSVVGSYFPEKHNIKTYTNKGENV